MKHIPSLSIETILSRLPDFISLKEIKSYPTRDKIDLVDSQFGDYKESLRNVFRGCGKHPQRKLLEQHPLITPLEKIKSKLPIYIKIVDDTYIGTNAKADFIDLEFGKYTACVSKILRGDGGRHPRRVLQKSLNRIKSNLPPFISIDELTYIGGCHLAKFIDKEYGEYWAYPRIAALGCALHPKRRSGKNISRKRVNIDEVKKRLPEYITIDESTYTRTYKLARFVDKKYGEFWARPRDVFTGRGNNFRKLEKYQQTCLKKYGVLSTSQDPAIWQKILMARGRTKILKHWKTGECVCCTASYEVGVVNYLNKYKIDFDWQIPFFIEDFVYYVDLFLKEENRYIEIKGWWVTPRSRMKWDKFHELMPNSEVWESDKLRKMGILNGKKLVRVEYL